MTMFRYLVLSALFGIALCCEDRETLIVRLKQCQNVLVGGNTCDKIKFVLNCLVKIKKTKPCSGEITEQDYKTDDMLECEKSMTITMPTDTTVKEATEESTIISSEDPSLTSDVTTPADDSSLISSAEASSESVSTGSSETSPVVQKCPVANGTASGGASTVVTVGSNVTTRETAPSNAGTEVGTSPSSDPSQNSSAGAGSQTTGVAPSNEASSAAMTEAVTGMTGTGDVSEGSEVTVSPSATDSSSSGSEVSVTATGVESTDSPSSSLPASIPEGTSSGEETKNASNATVGSPGVTPSSLNETVDRDRFSSFKVRNSISELLICATNYTAKSCNSLNSYIKCTEPSFQGIKDSVLMESLLTIFYAHIPNAALTECKAEKEMVLNNWKTYGPFEGFLKSFINDIL